MSAVVEAHDLSIPGRLAETSLALSAGELTCLVGRNGSGKTSLLHALAGIASPAGDVRIDGIDPGRLAPAERKRLLSYLPASREARWPLSAHDVVALGCAGPEDRKRIPELLADLELTAFADRRIDRMSTGERSRVLIARALVSRARLLLLDEPAANLDPLWQLRLMEKVRAAARELSCAALVAVHDLDLARDYSDRVLVMEEGRIAADGLSQEIFAGPVTSRIFGVERTDGRWRPVGQAG